MATPDQLVEQALRYLRKAAEIVGDVRLPLPMALALEAAGIDPESIEEEAQCGHREG